MQAYFSWMLNGIRIQLQVISICAVLAALTEGSLCYLMKDSDTGYKHNMSYLMVLTIFTQGAV
jgi:hypothetical protein